MIYFRLLVLLTLFLQAASRCTECALSLCLHCAEMHRRQRSYAQHEVLSIEEARRKGITRIRRQIMCNVHGERELSVFCSTCYKVTYSILDIFSSRVTLYFVSDIYQCILHCYIVIISFCNTWGIPRRIRYYFIKTLLKILCVLIPVAGSLHNFFLDMLIFRKLKILIFKCFFDKKILIEFLKRCYYEISKFQK